MDGSLEDLCLAGCVVNDLDVPDNRYDDDNDDTEPLDESPDVLDENSAPAEDDDDDEDDEDDDVDEDNEDVVAEPEESPLELRLARALAALLCLAPSPRPPRGSKYRKCLVLNVISLHLLLKRHLRVGQLMEKAQRLAALKESPSNKQTSSSLRRLARLATV